jgi:hypothetical protein
MRQGLDGKGSIPGKGKICLFSIALIPALGPTQPPTEYLTMAISPGGKQPGPEADHSSPSSAEVKNCGATPSFHHMSS